MDLLIKKLQKFGLEDFIHVYRFYLCDKTVSPNRVAAFLQFNPDNFAIINHPPDNFSKNEKLYELIRKTVKVRNFLEALNESGNEHILEFIKETDFSALGQLPSTSVNRNRRRGIWFNIPEPIDSFCGREYFLSQLHEKLQNQHPGHSAETVVAGPSRPKVISTVTTTTFITVLSQVKIVSGLGGIGKTETARRYISQYFKFYNNFIWIDAEAENSMTNSFLKLAEEIKIPIKNSEGKPREIQEILKEIYNKICAGGKSNLIVFDNAEDYSSCKNFFPFGLHPDLTKPVILATSRNQEWISPTGKIQVLPLDKMTEDESLEFILKQLEIPESEIPEFKEESQEFIQLIGGLPLALQQAVAYIRQEKELRELSGALYKISDYVHEFKSSMKKFLSFSPVPPPDSSPTVYVTWNLTLLKFFGIKNGKKAIQILAHLSFLYADKIPLNFLHNLVPEIQLGTFSGALKLLKKYSLIKINVNNYCLSIHRQLQFVILQYLKECGDVAKVVMNLVDNCKVVLENIKLSKSSDIFLNLHQIVNNPFNLIPTNEQFLYFMAKFGLVLSKASRYSESLELYKKVYSHFRELLGENHHLTLTTQSNIALQLSQLGKYNEGLTLYKELLKKTVDHPDFGVDHPLTIATKHNIAGVLRYQNKYQESLELSKQVLAQRTKIHGENDPETLFTQNEIALCLLNLGHFPKALNLFKDIEKKRVEILGAKHQHVLHTQLNKATVLYKMDKVEEASKVFNEVFQKQKEILGENHIETVRTLKWIALTCEKEGKFKEALEMDKKVYEITKTNLGEAHPDTIDVQINMAAVLHKQGKYGESLELFQQVLPQMNKIHEENYPETLEIQNQIASLHLKLGDFSKALDLYEELEKKYIETLGSDHAGTLAAKHNKAIVLFKMGKLEEATKLFNEVYEKNKEIVGKNHIETVNNREWIALILEQQGKLQEALKICKEVHEIRKKTLGVDHPKTITAKRNMANVLRSQGMYMDSLEIFQQVLAQMTKIHGENDPLTLFTQNQIAFLHLELENFSEALALFEQVEKKKIETLGPHHRDVLITKHNKACVLYKMGKVEEASKIFNEVYEKQKETLGENHSDTVNTLEGIAETLKRLRLN